MKILQCQQAEKAEPWGAPGWLLAHEGHGQGERKLSVWLCTQLCTPAMQECNWLPGACELPHIQ